MINIQKTFYKFWNKFLPAYISENVESEQKKPYLTFDIYLRNFLEESNQTVNIFYNSTSYEEITKKAEEILKVISNGITIPIEAEKGYIYIYKASPYLQYISTKKEEEKIINLSFNFRIIRGVE